ncbi:MAG TPA: M1 family aminopeptidase [bacterium]|nr:M1 family aminopeptidase [bacterium]
MAASAGALFLPEGPPTIEERLFTPHLYDGARGSSDAPAVPHDYDVKEYVIDVKLNDVQRSISGSCKIVAMSLKDNLTKPQFNLEADMNVTSVKQGGVNCTFKHEGAVLEVTLREPVNKGVNFTVTAYYGGSPRDGLYFTNKGVYVCSAMEEAQHWFPCFDLPYDKADRVELVVTCRNDWYVAGNGVLKAEKSNPDGTKTFTWVTTHRIATYLISISGAYNYSRFGTSWNGVPINYYVFPESRAAAEICFKNVNPMMNFFSNKFWRYPFDDERYGIAQAEMGYFGGMENQTCITLNQFYVRPDRSADHVLAHELSHMWWGDCISPGSWKDLWLTEGFGTYCDALWEEHAKGKQAFYERMQAFARQYFAEDQGHRFPVYDPASPWSATVYEKGAWVMHMLRHVMGDEKFFRAWNKYGREHEYGHAFTYELQRTMEDEYGSSLQEFFDDWVYKAGYPVFEYDWTASGNAVTIDVCQVQKVTPLTPLFDMPVDLTITTQNHGTRVEKVMVKNRFHRFRFTYGSPVTNVAFDKDGWVLCKKDRVVDIPVTSFDAQPAPAAVKLSWTTGGAAAVAGFNLYREATAGDAARAKLNGELITGRSPYRFVDRGVEPEERYRYWLEGVALGGARETFGPVECKAGGRAYAFALAPNHPNPARGSTTVTFSLPAPGAVTLSVYDVAGRKVGVLAAPACKAGENELVVDTSALAPGVYAYRLEAGGETAARRMVVVN